MENKINDILSELDKNVDLRHTYIPKKIKAFVVVGNTVKDIKKGYKNDADVSGDKYIKLYPTNTYNFDSFTFDDLEDIDLNKDTKDKKISLSSFYSDLKNEKETSNDIDLSDKKLNNSYKYSNRLFNNLNKYLKVASKFSRFKNNFIHTKPINLDNTDKIIDLNNNPIINTVDFFDKHYIFTKKFFKKASIILLIIFALAFFNKYIIENKINSGYEKLLSIKDNSGDIDFIKKQVKQSQDDFKIGVILFTPFLLLPLDDINNGYYVLIGGRELSKILTIGLEIFDNTNKYIVDNGGVENIKITSLLLDLRNDFNKIMILLYKTIVYYDNISELPNKDLNNKFIIAKDKLKKSYKLLNILNKDFDVFLNLLGQTKDKKYLLVFQNNDEIRPTGGFIGSVATLTLRSGKVIDLVKEDVYSYEWDINKVMTIKDPAPEGLNKITKTFGFRDSNYFVSFEDSSNSIKSFLDRINRDIDGIIYINQNTILDFLKYTGGVKFEQINETITEQNFSLIISTLVEAKVFKVGALGTPKQILFDFANVFFGILKEKKDYYAYIDIILKNIKSRDLVIYSFNPEENNLLWKLGLNGKINYMSTMDFAYPVYTSVGGNKSDRYIQLKYTKNIIRNPDCSIDTNLNIIRSHEFSKEEEQKVNELLDNHSVTDKVDVINIQGRGENKAYVRVLLPKEAIIEQNEGMNIIQSETYQMVDYYHDTRLLEIKNFDIKYKIPNSKCENYKFKIYKQPGIRTYDLEINDKDNTFREEDIEGDYVY
ncbi:MAG: DUF4012 domain-containing protein [Candidatus Gracilibacteria bacterium]|nr:DUF4012 domain-containing protein [Candidatus Gracilibacteria bacterium]